MRADGPRVTWTGQPYHVSTTVGPEPQAGKRRVSRQSMLIGVGAAALAGLAVGVVARPTPADQNVPPAAHPMPVEVATAAPAALPLAAPAAAAPAGKLDVRPTVVASAAPPRATPAPAVPDVAPAGPAIAPRAPAETSAMTYTISPARPPAAPVRPPAIDREPTLIDPDDPPADDDMPPPDAPN